MNQSPTITLIFKGLFLFAFEKDRKFCQAVIMRAVNHCLKITVKTKVASPKTPIEITFTVPTGNIEIDVPNRPQAIGVYEAGVFNRNSEHDKMDFRWALDIEGADLHNQSLGIRPNSVERSIFIRNGLFRTHTTREIDIISPSTQRRKTLATKEIGCDLFLKRGEDLAFKYGPGLDHSVILKKGFDEFDVSYEILIDNTCPVETVQNDEISDFVHYYEVINIPPEQQFKVVATPTTEPPQNDRRPCDPVYLGTTDAPLS